MNAKSGGLRSRIGKPNLKQERQWIPCQEFCAAYNIPRRRPPRQSPARYPTTEETACRKCVERLAAKGLIKIQKIEGRTYVSRDSFTSFGS